MLELGTALSSANRRGEARERLTAALELAESCGAAPLAEQARSQLSAAGARVRAARLSGPDALTASERRVADMAREGLTNRQIAQALFVTPKTVEVHLSSVYRKLGISSRNDLARALAPPEPVAPTA
jgi:DNA-binding NarL/FixJ family response regulator